MDIIQYARHIGISLHPCQRAILKALYNLPLNTDEKITVYEANPSQRDSFDTFICWGEKAYINFLTYTDRFRWAPLSPNILLFFGRVTGKSLLLEVMARYEAEILDRKIGLFSMHPQNLYLRRLRENDLPNLSRRHSSPSSLQWSLRGHRFDKLFIDEGSSDPLFSMSPWVCALTPRWRPFRGVSGVLGDIEYLGEGRNDPMWTRQGTAISIPSWHIHAPNTPRMQQMLREGDEIRYELSVIPPRNLYERSGRKNTRCHIGPESRPDTDPETRLF